MQKGMNRGFAMLLMLAMLLTSGIQGNVLGSDFSWVSTASAALGAETKSGITTTSTGQVGVIKDPEAGYELYYKLINSTEANVSIVGCKTTRASVKVTIPSIIIDETLNCKVDGSKPLYYTVTKIGEYAFYKQENLSGLVNGNRVTAVDRYAFAYCTKLNGIPTTFSLN